MEDFKEKVNYIILAVSPFIAYYIYYVITTELTPTNFPPRIAKCPDYWVYDKNTNGCFGSAYPNYFQNISNYQYDPSGYYIYDAGLGRLSMIRDVSDASFNFNTGDISNSSIDLTTFTNGIEFHYINFDLSYNSLCEKYEWAKKHKITWSGISTLNKDHCINREDKEKLDTSKDLLDDYRDYNAWYKNGFKNDKTWHNDTSLFRNTAYIKNTLSYIILGSILIGIIVAIKVSVFPGKSQQNKKTNYTSVYLILFVFVFLIINQII